MSNGFQVILGELRRRLLEGESHCIASDQTLEQLRAWARELSEQDKPNREKTVQPPEETAAGAGSRPNSNDLPDSGKRSATSSPTATAPGRQKIVTAQPSDEKFTKPPEIVVPAEGSKVDRLNWLRERVQNCEVGRSELRPGGKLVFGEGNPDADVFFVGEAPGAQEDKQGRPFVGPAGELLDKMIAATGLKRPDAYIANILTWRPRHAMPTGNRPPTQAEMKFALPYLIAQVEIVQPKVLVALGNTAVTSLLGPDPKRRLRDIRGTWKTFGETPLMITYHPSYLLHNNTKATKRQAWEDLLKIMEHLKLPISEKQRRYFL